MESLGVPSLDRKPNGSRGMVELIDASGDCWEWSGRVDRDGYGRFGHKGRMAHRLVWEALVGPIPEGYHVDHLCRNKACVNPDHLEPVTPAVNAQRTPPGRKGKHGNNLTRYTGHPNSLKTECPQGHPYSPDNTATNRRGSRSCLTCRAIRNQATIDEPSRRCDLYCRRGHVQFGPEADIYTDPTGVRVCRPCRRIRNRR